MMHPATERRRAVVALGGNALHTETAPYTLDVLDAETEGQIGYVLEMQLDNFIDHQDTVTVITRIVVDADDPALVVVDRVVEDEDGRHRGVRALPEERPAAASADRCGS